jgi:hypothetical protein
LILVEQNDRDQRTGQGRERLDGQSLRAHPRNSFRLPRWTVIENENRIERTIGLVILAIFAIGCSLVLRPLFTAVCFALILVVATWPAFERLQHSQAATPRSRLRPVP